MQKTQLETTELGSTGLQISRVGFGAWAIGGGGYEFGWGPQDDEESIAAIHRALDQGCRRRHRRVPAPGPGRAHPRRRQDPAHQRRRPRDRVGAGA
jgi:hypothetical protein